MSDNKLTDNPGRSVYARNSGEISDVIFYFVLAAVVFLSYGYEIFNFNLTIDEEIHANDYVQWHVWIAQGRWGMALLNYAIVQNPVIPVVSTFLGVVGLVLGIVLLLINTFNINKIGILSIAALAITTPTLPFTLTFSTLAYGVGFAFIALALSNAMIYKNSVGSAFLACLLAAFAISVYQTFLFAIAMLAIIHAWSERANSTSSVFTQYKYSFIYFFGSVLIYMLLNYVALKAATLDVVYVGQFIDLNSIFQSPIDKIISSFGRVFKILLLRPSQFGAHSIWLGAVVLVSIVYSFVYPILNKCNSTRVYTGVVMVAVVSIMAVAEAIAQGGAPLRSLVFFPVGIAIIVASAYTVSGTVGKYILIMLCGLAVIGNSQVNNHLFASSVSAEFKDRMLAEAIISEVRRLKPERPDYSLLKVEVIGNRAWPVTGVQSKTETFGASFFEWDGGNRYRAAAYLNLNGLASIGASEEDRLHVYEKGKTMPVWPHAGWVAIDNDTLILKFDAYSSPQKASLCALGIQELCN